MSNTLIKFIILISQFHHRNSINGGIPDLRKYVSDYASRLDLNYTQSRTTELVNFYNQLVSDVNNIKNGNSQTSCNVNCPTNWTLDTNACSCSCEVNACDGSTQSIDYYHCQCSANNGCTLTKDSCAADGNKLLDYTNCACNSY